jgi:hypothetical protein
MHTRYKHVTCTQDFAKEVTAETSELTDALRTSVILAREYLKEVQVRTTASVRYEYG